MASDRLSSKETSTRYSPACGCYFRLRLLGCLFVAASFWGCGDGQSAGYALRGEVTLNGQPLPKGQLLLVPLATGSGTRPLAIVEGEFSCGPEHGLADGNYRVEITAYKPTGRTVEDPDLPNTRTEETRQIIPRKYNRNSTITLTLPSPNAKSLQFDLKSR